MSVDTSVMRALPVLDREGVERQHLDAQAGGPFDDVAHRVDARAVSLDTRQVTLRGPAAVAVHDHGHMSRQAVEVDLTGERLFRGAGRQDGKEVIERHRVSKASKPR